MASAQDNLQTLEKKSKFDFESPDTNEECPAERCYVKVVTPRGIAFDVQIDVESDGIGVRVHDYYGLQELGELIVYEEGIEVSEEEKPRKLR